MTSRKSSLVEHRGTKKIQPYRNTEKQHESFTSEIEAKLTESIRTKEQVRSGLIPVIAEAAELMLEALGSGHKVLFFGNGGSAADCQHLAAELVGKMLLPRRALPAIALTTDTSNLTAIGNDFGFEAVFGRQIEALGAAGDVAVGISTSGKSPNVLVAVKTARAMGIRTIAFTGRGGGELAELVDVAITVPSDNTQRIQESHITIGQIICELMEAHFSKQGTGVSKQGTGVRKEKTTTVH